MIGREMEKWDDEALHKVADARLINAGSFQSGCLLSTAFGSSWGAADALGHDRMWTIVSRWDGAFYGFRALERANGISTLTRRVTKRMSAKQLTTMAQNRARAILARRALSRMPAHATKTALTFDGFCSMAEESAS